MAAAKASKPKGKPGTDFNGAWVLDASNKESQALNGHLEALGLDELCKLAAEKVDFACRISQVDATTFTVETITSLGQKSRTLRLGETHAEGSVRMQLIKVAAAPPTITIQTEWPKGRLIDERTILDPMSYRQSLEMHHKSGAVTRSTRIFIRAAEA